MYNKERRIRTGWSGHYLENHQIFCHFIRHTEWFLVLERETDSGDSLENPGYPRASVAALGRSSSAAVASSAKQRHVTARWCAGVATARLQRPEAGQALAVDRRSTRKGEQHSKSRCCRKALSERLALRTAPVL